MQKILMFDLQRGSFADGHGIRTTVFFKGCNLKCKWCHNPESQVAEPQLLFYREQCTGCGKCKAICDNSFENCMLCGKCADACPQEARKLCGKEVTVSELYTEILKDKAYYDNSGGGVTFSGGECMLQTEALAVILKLCKKSGIHTAVDTAGAVSWESMKKIYPLTDLFLYDVKCITEKLHREGTGCSNRLILENLKKLSECYTGDIIIRIPVIPGFNANMVEMKKIATYLKNIRYTAVELLPYHKMGEHKYDALGRKKTVYIPPSKEELNQYQSLF